MKVAVVGSGPAGFYAASALLTADPPAEVDLIERLPTPWGLVRLGVAPDHPKIKAVSRAFEKTAARPGFRFFGNVEVGRHVAHDELRERYDAVVYAVGAQTDRQLGIPGEDLPGSWAATEFVAWYNGHPDYQHLEFDLSGERAVVIGNGNVALDVARMLALTPDELAPTDTTDPAIDAINAPGVREILVLGRRGPAQAALTPLELGELGELAGADVIVDPAQLELDPASAAALEAAPPTVKRNVDHLRDYAGREPDGKPRRIALRFLSSPVAIVGDGRVEGIEVVRNELVDGRAVRDATSTRRSRAGSSSAASATAASRFRACRSTSRPGRCRTRAGRVEPGLYVAGWIKRGPSGVIGDEQEGRDRDGRAPARGRARGTAAARERRGRPRPPRRARRRARALRGLGGDRRGREGCRRAARPTAREALQLGRPPDRGAALTVPRPRDRSADRVLPIVHA